ncbi:hypothetical protein GGX14DRAFT_299186, partial [Mycena pura]
MLTCSICYEPFTSPISIPCGHVFCQECIRRHCDSKSCSPQNFCPTCRSPFSIITIDPAFVPPNLRPHILSSIRPVIFDVPKPGPVATPAAPSCTAGPASASGVATPSDLACAKAEITALRLSCAAWRRKAEIHAAANNGLLDFARTARDHALRLRSERDAARSRCSLLRR